MMCPAPVKWPGSTLMMPSPPLRMVSRSPSMLVPRFRLVRPFSWNAVVKRPQDEPAPGT
ncbi:unannotated protein [freshwater metagenome]|uniref:Unannotated protein n=1 Tax=freshwater metagenome TaxID=449393 RepID=A0A6J7HMK2_9ZZZZ